MLAFFSRRMHALDARVLLISAPSPCMHVEHAMHAWYACILFFTPQTKCFSFLVFCWIFRFFKILRFLFRFPCLSIDFGGVRPFLSLPLYSRRNSAPWGLSFVPNGPISNPNWPDVRYACDPKFLQKNKIFFFCCLHLGGRVFMHACMHSKHAYHACMHG